MSPGGSRDGERLIGIHELRARQRNELVSGEQRALAEHADHRDRARKPQSRIIRRHEADDPGIVLQDRQQIAIEIGILTHPDRPLVGVADDLDDIDIVFADVIENLGSGSW